MTLKIGLIILYFVIGLIIATILNVKMHEDDSLRLALFFMLWECLLIGFAFMSIAYIIGYIPKTLGKNNKGEEEQ